MGGVGVTWVRRAPRALHSSRGGGHLYLRRFKSLLGVRLGFRNSSREPKAMSALRRLTSASVDAMLIALALMACILGVRGFWREDVFGWYGPPYPGAHVRQAWQCATGRGGLTFIVQTHRPGHIEPFPFAPTGFTVGSYDQPRYAGTGLLNQGQVPTLGFALISFRPIPTTGFVAPAWFVAAILALRPALRLWRHLRGRRRRRRERCGRCGYDLRASPGRCPECGTQPGWRDGSKEANGATFNGQPKKEFRPAADS
jgi:hypothetical protein